MGAGRGRGPRRGRTAVASAALRVTRLARAINAPAPVDLLVTDPTEIAERGDLPGILRVALREGRWCMTKRAERLRREVWRWRKPGTPDVRRTVTENARTLAFDTHQFGSE